MNEIKTKKMGSTFAREISYILTTEVKDPNAKFATITGCDVTNDLSYAKVYFTTLKENVDNVTNSLNKAANFIELELAKRIDIRKMPQITFHYDTSYEYGQNIEKLIEEIHKEDE